MNAIMQYTNAVTNMNVVVQQMITAVQPIVGIVNNNMLIATESADGAADKVKELGDSLHEIGKEYRLHINATEVKDAIVQISTMQKTMRDSKKGPAIPPRDVSGNAAPGPRGIALQSNALAQLADRPSAGKEMRGIPEQAANMASMTAGTGSAAGLTQQLTEEGGSKFGEHMQSFISLIQNCSDLTRQFGVDTSAVQPIIDGLSASLGIYNAVMDISKIKVGEFTIAEWLLNSAFWANPITLIVGSILALVGVIVYAWNHFEGFRTAVTGVWESMKAFGNLLKELIIDRIKDIIKGIGGIGKAIGLLFDGEFSAAYETAKNVFTGSPVIRIQNEFVRSAEFARDPAATSPQKFRLAQQVADTQKYGNSPAIFVFLGSTAQNSVGGQQTTPQVLVSSGVNTSYGSQNSFSSPTQASSITGGGSKTVNISIGKFFDNLNITAQNMSEGIDDFERRVEEVFLRIVNRA